jgi:hypothetical protein
MASNASAPRRQESAFSSFARRRQISGGHEALNINILLAESVQTSSDWRAKTLPLGPTADRSVFIR